MPVKRRIITQRGCIIQEMLRFCRGQLKTIMIPTMRIPDIPDTATEEYLQKVEEKIRQRLESTNSQAVVVRLNALLEEVRQRQDILRQEKMQAIAEKASAAEISDEEKDHLKERLQDISEEIKQRADVSHDTQTLSPLTPAVKDALSAQFDESAEMLNNPAFMVMKDRMKDMLAEIQRQRQPSPEGEEGVLDLGEESELSGGAAPGDELAVGETYEFRPKTEAFELGEDFEVHPEEQAAPPQTDEFVLGEEFEVAHPPETPPVQAELEQKVDLELSELEVLEKEEEALRNIPDYFKRALTREEREGDLTFESACRRIGKGESLVLFDHFELSEREQMMVWAFHEYLHQMKGVKRQQSYDMQHLTARSIRELEQIFKTYQIQGYLRAELNNIYNRLLNLRGRFSVLLH